jgi:hypothetical protein
MSAVVEAAWITVLGAGGVGVSGFVASIVNTSRTVGQARENRVWDHRAAVYVDVLGAVSYRGAKRLINERDLLGAGLDLEAANQTLAMYKEPDWHMMQARQVAFGSQCVVTSTFESGTANGKAEQTFAIFRTRPRDETAAQAAIDALNAADAADDKLVGLIRKELQRRDDPLVPPGPHGLAEMPNNPSPAVTRPRYTLPQNGTQQETSRERRAFRRRRKGHSPGRD